MTTSPATRRLTLFLGDTALIAAAILGAAWLRFDGRVPPEVVVQLPATLGLSVVLKTAVFALTGMYALSWAQVGLVDMLGVVLRVTVGWTLFAGTVMVLRHEGLLGGFSRAMLLLDFVLTLLGVGAFRIAPRVLRTLTYTPRADGRRALIVGAGAAGDQLARSLRQTPGSGYTVVGFVDDDPVKRGTVIHGLRVFGTREEMPAIIRAQAIDAVLIAIPSAPSRVIRQFVSAAREAGVREIRIVPGLDQLLKGQQLSFNDLREVQLTDLLGRELVTIDKTGIGVWLRDRVVLVTGAGGSIGSELARQLAAFRPAGLVLLDWDESGLFWVEQDLRRLEQPGVGLIADIRDPDRMRQILAAHRPHVVFHAAAYKHVGMMERHPVEAVATNVLGTLTVAVAARDVGVESFVLISTDKAVNPTSVMGVTKRVAEQLCLALAEEGTTRFVAVRFGNVLGSRGSVVPLFQEQIRRGAPIVIRGKNMRRYFMAASEAALLVLQASVMGRGGEVFVLDMGEPVRIVDLACELIRLSGLQPGTDVPIVFADPEPGEKEYEDFLTAEEGTLATRHDRIFIARSAPVSAPRVLAQVERLRVCAARGDVAGIVQIFSDLVPSYRPSEYLMTEARIASQALP
ncbi:MAG: nucleoside-diphosphate sugar epimerase/dehydratase [Armatimonadota bacterium]|nr:nucleoside-diphosphate sugar epimerase/dehydratase [Armatimonadota bacterium]